MRRAHSNWIFLSLSLWLVVLFDPCGTFLRFFFLCRTLSLLQMQCMLITTPDIFCSSRCNRTSCLLLRSRLRMAQTILRSSPTIEQQCMHSYYLLLLGILVRVVSSSQHSHAVCVCVSWSVFLRIFFRFLLHHIIMPCIRFRFVCVCLYVQCMLCKINCL